MNKDERERFNLYLAQYPEERTEVNRLIERSDAIRDERHRKAQERVAKVQYYRRLLDEKFPIK